MAKDSRRNLPTEYGIEVSVTTDGMIEIRQDDPLGEDDAIILISPSRVDALIGFLRSAKDEVLTDVADAAERRTHAPPLPNG